MKLAVGLPAPGAYRRGVMRLEITDERIAMKRLLRILTVVIISCSFGCSAGDSNVQAERKASAERFFRGVYGCDLTVLEDLASDDFLVSYPIFETLLGKSTIVGREAVKGFYAGFCQRWADSEVTIHEVIADGETVVLLWSYRARNVGVGLTGQSPTNREHSWGGITVYRFDRDGKIVAEIGEESDPGPAQRVSNTPRLFDEPEGAMRGIRAAGTLTPEGAPEEPPVRIDAGESCVVDVKQSYTIVGTLSGSAEVDFRILVAGPCGSPPGTFDEEWIAHGEFIGTMNGTAAAGRFDYAARVGAGGDMEGRIVLGQGLAGELTVHGNFGEGSLSYDGWVDEE